MATLQSFQVLQEVGILKNFKTKINIKSGGSRFVQVNANLIYDASGMPIAAQGVLRDVTNEEEVSAILEEQKEALKDSQKRLEAVISDLQAQKEKYSSIIANMNLGLVEVDNEDLVQLVNKSFCTLSGYTEKELYGNKLGQLLHVSDPKIILVHQKNRLKGISDTYEVNVQVKGGQKKHWLISGAPRYNEKGQVIGSIGIHLDITEQYELSEQKEQLLKDLESSNEGLQEYAHIVSHDLKSPLRSISALVSWLEEDFGDKLGPAGLSQLTLMQDKIASMDQLITEILRYSSIGSEKARFEICPTLKLVQQLKATIYWPEQIALRFNGTMPSIKADKTQLQQLFQNLLSNAISHMDKPKGQIEIGYNDLGDLHEFSVKDNGIGIPKAYQEKIFEIFETLESGKGSSGIGLSIVKKIVQLHGGTIWVKSEYGAGATFYFTIKKDIS